MQEKSIIDGVSLRPGDRCFARRRHKGHSQSRLGIGRTTLWRKLKDYGFDRTDAKDR